MIDSWLDNVDKGMYTGIILIDLRKAFDTVNHTILLQKLKAHGCSLNSIKWFRSYLSNRQQSVQIKNELSETSSITIGVPQGSILGPLLFTVFINDLPNAVSNGRIDMYADDTTLSVCSTKIDEIEAKLTDDMKDIIKWINKNKLALNIDKTKCMLLTSSQKRKYLNSEKDLQIVVNDVEIECVDYVKCLGITIDKNLLFHDQVTNVVSKCSQKTGLLRRASGIIDSLHLPMLYKAFI